MKSETYGGKPYDPTDMQKIIKKLMETADLLEQCNFSEKADWFKLQADIILHAEDATERRKSLVAVKSILTGMGSFTDLPLLPKQNSILTEKKARETQWMYAEQLGDLIKKELNQNNKIKDNVNKANAYRPSTLGNDNNSNGMKM